MMLQQTAIKRLTNKRLFRCLGLAINLFMEIGRFSMVARHCKEIGEIYEAEENLELALEYFKRATALYRGEGEVTTNHCQLKVAQFAAQLEQYPKAIQNFEDVARQSINNNLLKDYVEGRLLCAGLCLICKGDTAAINNALKKYQKLDPTFSGTPECKFLSDLGLGQDLGVAIDEEDVVKFTDVVKECDSLFRLGQLKTTLLLRAKNALKAKEVDEGLPSAADHIGLRYRRAWSVGLSLTAQIEGRLG